jgi:hypothetical protein
MEFSSGDGKLEAEPTSFFFLLSAVHVTMLPVRQTSSVTKMIPERSVPVEEVCDEPLSDESNPPAMRIAATVYEALGIPQDILLPDQFDRPLPILDHGQTIAGVFKASRAAAECSKILLKKCGFQPESCSMLREAFVQPGIDTVVSD